MASRSLKIRERQSAPAVQSMILAEPTPQWMMPEWQTLTNEFGDLIQFEVSSNATTVSDLSQLFSAAVTTSFETIAGPYGGIGNPDAFEYRSVIAKPHRVIKAKAVRVDSKPLQIDDE